MLNPKTIDPTRAMQVLNRIDPEIAQLTARLDELHKKRAPYAAALGAVNRPRRHLTAFGWVVVSTIFATAVAGITVAIQALL